MTAEKLSSYLEVPDLWRSVDGSSDDVSAVGRQLDAVDADLLGGQHDVRHGRPLTAGVQLHVPHLERRRRRSVVASAARQVPVRSRTVLLCSLCSYYFIYLFII